MSQKPRALIRPGDAVILAIAFVLIIFACYFPERAKAQVVHQGDPVWYWNCLSGCGTSSANVTSTDVGGTITTGGSFQSAIAAASDPHNPRSGCRIFNPPTATENLAVYFGASPTLSHAVALRPGWAVGCSTGSGKTLGDQVWVEAATTAHAFAGFVQ